MKGSTVTLSCRLFKQLRPDFHTVSDLQLNTPDIKEYLVNSKAFSLFFKPCGVGVKTTSFDPQMFAFTFG